LTGSLAVTPATRGALKQNIVLVDNDAVHVFQPARLQRELRALGLLDVQVLVHTGRAREEVTNHCSVDGLLSNGTLTHNPAQWSLQTGAGVVHAHKDRVGLLQRRRGVHQL
jgi:hypothetical protein